jgi:hypothetical protein
VWSAGPVRVYLVPLPVWVAVQYGFSVSRLYFGMCGVIEQVRSLRDGTISRFLGFALAGRYD